MYSNPDSYRTFHPKALKQYIIVMVHNYPADDTVALDEI